MGRKSLILLCSVLVFAFSACEKSGSETKVQNNKAAPAAISPVTAPSIPKDGSYGGTGTVTKINNEPGSVEIDHEEIKGLMPAMKMEFNVKDKALLKGLAVGDKIDFVIEYKNPQEIIVGIKKLP
jgi:Cu(I)/Ag(I) efflux system protein CusF